MTLAEARLYLHPYIENGRCSNTEMVRLVINEAQRRLYSMGNFIGLVRRWGVTVDTNGEFTRPINCEHVIRISELGVGLPYTADGANISADANAFTFDNPSVLTFTQIRPNRYKITGPHPPAVDVMGKVRYADAREEDHSLIVTDRDALKLMCLGIHNENSNAPELANELITKAVNHMQLRTELAKETVKLSLYQNMLSSCKPGTRGYMRAKAALGITGGDRVDDGRIIEILWEAEKKLMAMTQHYHVYKLTAKRGVFYLPHAIESILRVDIEGKPVKLAGFTEEFLFTGLGYRTDSKPGLAVIPRGEVAAPEFESGVVTASFAGSVRGVKLLLEGEDTTGTQRREVLTVNGGITTTGTVEWASLSSITADPRDGSLTVRVGTMDIAKLQPFEMDSRRASYFLPSCEKEEAVEIQVLGRARWVPKIRDEQRLQVEDDIALNYMVISIHADRAGELEKALAFEQRAIQQIEITKKNRHAGETVKIDRHPTPWGLNRVKGRR